MLLLILGPFFLWGAQIEAWTAHLLESAAPQRSLVAALLGLLLAVDILLPIPSSLVSTACGVFAGIAGGTLVSWTGMTLSCVAGYWLARSGRPVVRRLMGERELERLQVLSARFGDWVLIICRPVPVLAEAAVLLAGMSEMRPGRFLLMAALANLGISAVYATVGALAASVNSFLVAFAAAILLPLAAMLLSKTHPIARPQMNR
jgi:uncharacterized membrane protein YdjX (TVP38/TMEM64 family)